ncbi:MAG: hypothetical protein GWP08_19065 [Nitrospiraceae bacterium]|nr:hypothetical protein [Nitrospiraceae bacterium]
MPGVPRKYVGVMFKCCHVYTRIYLNKAGTAYTGKCPKCAAKITLKVGAGGSDSRFWTAQ